MDGLCIYKYQLATQVDRRQVHLSQKSDIKMRVIGKVPEHIHATTTAIVDGGRSIAEIEVGTLFTFALVFHGA